MERKVRISDGIVMWAGPTNVIIVAKVRFLGEAGSCTGWGIQELQAWVSVVTGGLISGTWELRSCHGAACGLRVQDIMGIVIR